MSPNLPLQVRRTQRRNDQLGSALWEVCQIPGLYVFKHGGVWQVATQLQQRSLAYRVWNLIAHQRFPTRRETLQAIQLAQQVQNDRCGS